MSTSIIIGFIAVIMLIIGIVIGRMLAGQQSTANRLEREKEIAGITFQRDHLAEELKKKATEHGNEITALKQEREKVQIEKERIQNALTQRETEYAHLREKTREQKQAVGQLQEKFKVEFENLAQKILEQKSEKFTRLTKENLQHILNPLQDKIKGFEEKMEKSEKESLKRHTELSEQLKYLHEQSDNI